MCMSGGESVVSIQNRQSQDDADAGEPQSSTSDLGGDVRLRSESRTKPGWSVATPGVPSQHLFVDRRQIHPGRRDNDHDHRVGGAEAVGRYNGEANRPAAGAQPAPVHRIVISGARAKHNDREQSGGASEHRHPTRPRNDSWKVPGTTASTTEHWQAM